MATTQDYLDQLITDKQTIVDNINIKGGSAEDSDTFTELAPKILTIPTTEKIQYDTMPEASLENLGKIVQYVGETGQYKNSCFYKCIKSKTATGIISPEGSSISNITVNVPLAIAKLGGNGDYEFSYVNSTYWAYNGTNVRLYAYGVDYTGTGASGTKITVTIEDKYEWEQIRDFTTYRRGSDYIVPLTNITEPLFYKDIQWVIDYYRNHSNNCPDFSLNGYKLGYINQGSYSSSAQYRLYILYFSRISTNINYNLTMNVYVEYNTYVLYDNNNSGGYKPSGITTNYSYLTSHQSLAQYLSKTNTTSYTPTDDYNPATKKYVDDKTASIDLSMYLSKTNTTSYTPTGAYNPSTKQYVDTVFSTINSFSFRVVSSLPTTDISTSTIYLLGTNNPYTMNIYAENQWVQIGTTAVDFEPEVISNSSLTYTINTLYGNKSYKLGEKTVIEIASTTTFEKETVLYFSSGTTATIVSMPEAIINLGDCPIPTTSGGIMTFTCKTGKNYIISVLNNIAIWKEY